MQNIGIYLSIIKTNFIILNKDICNNNQRKKTQLGGHGMSRREEVEGKVISFYVNQNYI